MRTANPFSLASSLSRASGLRAGRRGMTLLELVIAISVIAVLLAILVPAVQSARETSRRTTCISHLRNLGAAIENHASAHRNYPDGYFWREELLPLLDERPLADAIFQRDFSVSLTAHHVPAFTCPSDPLADDGTMHANYFANFGTGLQKYGYNGFLSPRPGGVDSVGAWDTPHVHGPTGPEDIHDGLSQTAALSEALVQQLPGSAVSDRRRRVWMLDGWDLVFPDRLDAVKQLCLAIEPSPSAPQAWGRGWDVLGRWEPPARALPLSPLSWGYDHALPPNSPACLVGSRYGVLPAGSLHPGGVNVLFGDGRVDFVSQHIDAAVWCATGERSSL